MSAEIQTIEVMPLATFQSTMDDLTALVSDYLHLVVTDETLVESKKARMSLRNKRLDIQRIEKQNTDQLNDLKNQNWENAKKLLAIIAPAEERIDSGIKAIEQRKADEKAEKERIERERLEAIAKAEADRLAAIEAERLAAIEAAQKVEAERLAALQIEIDERNRIEEERLNKIKAEQDAKEAAMLSEQRRIQKEQEEREAKIKAEQAAIDKQKRDIEESKIREANEKVRLAELEQARKEAAEKAIKDAEIKAIKEAEQKLETERLAKVEADRKEALRPDKQKLIDFANSLNGIAFPVLKDRSAHTILLNALNSIENVSKAIISETEKL
jgi:colicin import membrane protein